MYHSRRTYICYTYVIHDGDDYLLLLQSGRPSSYYVEESGGATKEVGQTRAGEAPQSAEPGRSCRTISVIFAWRLDSLPYGQ